MTYYLLLKGDTEKDVMFETNVLGEESFGVFYPSIGFILMNKIVNERPELLEDIKILDDHKTSHTITEFLDKLEKWRIKKALLLCFLFVSLIVTFGGFYEDYKLGRL